MKNILLCTLGASWAVIPEVYGFLAPHQLPLYQNHPKKDQLKSLRTEYGLQSPDEIWICTTGGAQTQNSLYHLQQWIGLLQKSLAVRIWQAAGTDQLSSQEECALIRELILRACLAAHHHAGEGQVVLSLAGGRKTMGADMQWAGVLFGCRALVHVVGREPLPEQLKAAEPKLFVQALPKQISSSIFPLVTGMHIASDLLDIDVDGKGPVIPDKYPLPMAVPGKVEIWQSDGTRLQTELKNRERASGSLYGNYLKSVSSEERHENWRSLYRLPPRVIERLRGTPLISEHRNWLDSLPKADLHRHLGGCLHLADQRRVGQCIWQSLTAAEKSKALDQVESMLRSPEWPWDWPESLKTNGERSHNIAALLLHADDEQIEYNLWGVTSPRTALKNTHVHGFTAYERPGELTGSAVLSHPASIEPYADAIVRQARKEGLAYLELRGSPQKYGDGIRFLHSFHKALQQALTSLPDGKKPVIRFIIVTDRRHSREELKQTLQMAVKAREQLPDFVAGLDMAGDEAKSNSPPQEISDLFIPAFEVCLPLTIHAGEGEPADSIWQAAYHLHADRIGHGLTINERPKLAQRFRDRAICLELCPTSNREVVGFRDLRYPETEKLPEYPMTGLWDKGLHLTICTDNPGISRTTLTDEYLAAAAMCPGSRRLTCWDALAMIKQGFVYGFLSGKDKEKLLKKIDIALFEMMMDIEAEAGLAKAGTNTG